ncbi:hypothetical protein F3Y22_tig00110944pilonHSYRG00017 [Hibiscus syriacus]|uniref:Uncharacterized protein n=1 Tax=Hibiscus syriacus TaxID=106335 RepID=A0A6A2ZAN2_HIBSY|nr:hypothetical protein F3Y22_tig00110944pilonHSYRG00017 [Hibiscus syriacus]
MKGRSSKQVVAVEWRRRFKQEPHLSGAYIRSLVRQLTLARCTKDPESVDGFGARNLTKLGDGFSETPQSQSQQPEPPPPQQHRKQVRNRRRVHTSRPYQERLINMAEARREIVTALNLPSQNLNFHFNSKNPSIYSSPSSSSSPTLSVAVQHEVGHGTGADSTESYGGGSLHQAVDDEGMRR